jgi:hypothetical protein
VIRTQTRHEPDRKGVANEQAIIAIMYRRAWGYVKATIIVFREIIAHQSR